MIGRAEDLAAQGFRAPRATETTDRTRPLPGRLVDAVRAFNDDLNPNFFRALAVLGCCWWARRSCCISATAIPMSWMDAIYFSTETLATVGFGDFNFCSNRCGFGCGAC